MKQQINLYLSEFRVKRDRLTVLLMGKIVGVVVVVMLLLSSYDYFLRWQLNGELAELRSTLSEETQKTGELDGLLAQRAQSEQLTLRLADAEARLIADRQVINFLGRTKLGNLVGFSEHFKDLSRASIDGFMLSNIRISSGGEQVSLNGQVADSSLVVKFVSNLKFGNSSIRDLNFSTNIARDSAEDRVFPFALSTSR
ncbi:MAG: cell division protein FtsL [Pseudohongiellaceae bacterium]|jgi:cell division protein FtsL